MAYTTIDDPGLFFNTVLWTGDGVNGRSLTGVGFQPDWVWSKCRSNAVDHGLQDSVRGVGKVFHSNSTTAEGVDNWITALNSDGFTLSNSNEVNQDTRTFVAWNWKAGTSFSNDASATGVGSIDSSGSVNTTAGFSIITYSGTDGTATVAHGLGVAPDFIWFKRRNASKNNTAYHSALGNTYSAYPDNTSAASTNYDYFADTSPTSTVFTVKKDEDYDEVNASGGTYVAYCFSSKQGYSKFGAYTGNANADGTFIYTGFKPAWFLFKDTESTTSWIIKDNKRLGYNGIVPHLQANTSDAENTDGWSEIDFLSNGIKLRNADNSMNKSGSKFIYMAFAENPFVTSTGVPATAR